MEEGSRKKDVREPIGDRKNFSASTHWDLREQKLKMSWVENRRNGLSVGQ